MAAVVRQLHRPAVTVRKAAVLLLIGLGAFIVALLIGLWLQGWFR